MHSQDISLPEGEFTIHHNGDYSGDVVITTTNNAAKYVEIRASGVFTGPVPTVQLTLPFDLIRAIYLSYARTEMIRRFENSTDNDLEDFFIGGPS